MICPACKTNNTNPLDAQYCIQCGSDLYVHRLLREISEAIQMKSEITKTEQESPKKLTWLFVVWQILPVILLMTCAMFGIFVGMRFLAFIDHEESYRIVSTERSRENYCCKTSPATFSSMCIFRFGNNKTHACG